MKIICLVKFVPDVDSFRYDYEQSLLIRENVRLQMNPDDVCAVAFALKVKATHPGTSIEVVTMAPATVTPHMEDLLRIGVDRGTIIADRLYAGSDTFATTTVLARYLKRRSYDVIFTGTHAIDGDTSHIPSQLGACRELNQMSGIVRVDESRFSQSSAVFDVETEEEVATYEMALPAILSLTRESKYKLPYASRKDLERDVSQQLAIITNQSLAFGENEVSLSGSKTQVVQTVTKEFDQKDRIVVKADHEGIDYVYRFLKEKGYV
jgi:electron transfer flavoprotein beta subunit